MAASSSSSESEDEEKRQIMAEIAGFATKDLSNAKLVVVNKEVVRRNKLNNTSLRNVEAFGDQEEQNPFTPEFQRHIAKKLSSYLDGCIQEQPSHSVEIKGMSQISGIQLFNSSRDKLSDVLEKDNLKAKKPQILKRSRELSSSSESSYDEDALARFQEAAVCGHSIIDKGYLSSGKNCLNSESIRSGDGVLTENDDEDKVKKHKKKNKEKKSKNKDSVLEYNELNHVKEKKKKERKNERKISKT